MSEGLCECGCGELTAVATKTDASTNRVKGRPMRFVRGHHRRKPLPILTCEIMEARLAA